MADNVKLLNRAITLWETNLALTKPPVFYEEADSTLCKEYLYSHHLGDHNGMCLNCPIAKFAQHWRCFGTPFHDIPKYFHEWKSAYLRPQERLEKNRHKWKGEENYQSALKHEQETEAAFKNAVRKQIDFLKTVRDKEQCSL
jgi:hypothetical protein